MKINDEWSINRLDQFNYEVVQTVKGKKKTTNEEIDVSRRTYHGSLESACEKVLTTVEDTKNVTSILNAITKAKQDIIKALKGAELIIPEQTKGRKKLND